MKINKLKINTFETFSLIKNLIKICFFFRFFKYEILQNIIYPNSKNVFQDNCYSF